eukprot:2156705-Pyramimonas_sp.AAC.1
MKPGGKLKSSSKKLVKHMLRASRRTASRSSRWGSRSSPPPARSSRTGSAASAQTKLEANTWTHCDSCSRPRP